MTDRALATPFATDARVEHVFPTLTAEQMKRIAAHGRTRSVAAGEILIEAGDHAVPFFVVTRGTVQIVRPGSGATSDEQLIVEHHAGQFTGETNMLSGRPSLVRAWATESGEVIELDRTHLMALVQNDPELSDILMRAFILRRVELIAQGIGDAVLLGSNHCAGTLRIREFLTRNGHPFRFVDLDKEADVQMLLDRFQVGIADVPVVVARGGVLKNPSNQQIADILGFNPTIDESAVRDIVIAGAGPSGLAAAVYGASEGLDVLVLESSAPGGQAGSSSKIENYLGFPLGVSGEELTGRAFNQAEKFAAKFQIARSAGTLACERRPYIIVADNGARVPARTVIIATGAEYRKLPIENRARFEGAGVYYGATAMEAALCRGEEVIVVGGGNSAGQAAVYLSGYASHVHVLCRSERLADTMSRYLEDRLLTMSDVITLRLQTEITALSGGTHLEQVRWADKAGRAETRPIRHVFTMTGARPSTDWLDACVALDGNGFIKTGPDLSREDLDVAGWPLTRPPYLLETSLPGVFAVGDVRSGSMKRVASAVGEGSTAVAFVHRVLKE